jgi:dynein heavy chain
VIPKRYPDENTWLWELNYQFGKILDEPLQKIEDYLKVFSKHEKILNMKPEEIIESL